jgi:hypothetical protein
MAVIGLTENSPEAPVNKFDRKLLAQKATNVI